MIDKGEHVRKLVMGFMVRSGLSHLLRPYLGGQGAILMLHRVTKYPPTETGFNSNLIVDPEFLDRLIVEMKAQGFDFVSMDEVVRRIGAGCRGENRFAAITLDDGYRDNLVEALPVFEQHQTPFSIFIAPGLIDGTVEPWWDLVEAIIDQRDVLHFESSKWKDTLDCRTGEDKAKAFELICRHLSQDLPEQEQVVAVRDLARAAAFDFAAFRKRLFMTWDEIRAIASHDLCTIGAHTVHHYSLRRLDTAIALAEMSQSAERLERELGQRPHHFAYPYGFEAAVGEREAELARDAGFVSAVTTRHGIIQSGHAGHMQALPRISVNGRYQKMMYLQAMLSGVTVPMANRGRVLVTV